MKLISPHYMTIAFASLVLACGPSAKSQTSDAADIAPRTCTSTIECLASNQVCNPATQECVDTLPCATSLECGQAAYCSDDNLCTPATTGTPCSDDLNCLPGEDCQTSGFCGCDGDSFIAEEVEPNIMIVLDRSGSMTDKPGEPKWTDAKTAVSQITSQFEQEARFGLLMFPTPNRGACGVTSAQVLPENLNAAGAIAAAMNAATPNVGSTPLYSAVNFVKNSGYLIDPTRENIMIIVADGDNSCSGTTGSDIVNLAAQMHGSNPSVKTFTVGYDFDSGFDFLSDVALAGGTQTAYQASNSASLNTALNAIVGASLSCTYAMNSNPDVNDAIVVIVDGVEATEDPDNGYTYDRPNNQIIFHGQSCDALQSGTASEVQVLTGCAVPPG